jgi:hypothetical protein
MRSLVIVSVLAFLFLPVRSWALDVGSDGSDGAFSPVGIDSVDLGQATTGDWKLTPGNGHGVYDPAKWAVVFKYSSVNIAPETAVYFKNHPSGAPVVWLVQEGVTIAGTISLNGAGSGYDLTFSTPGPGGFRGGRGRGVNSEGSAGLGPGGGDYVPDSGVGAGGSYATPGLGNSGPTYGNERILPLIGGSGGAGCGTSASSGGAGGGAILIAANNTISVAGSILANSGSPSNGGGGSGGGIRFIAGAVNGSAEGLSAVGSPDGGGNGGGAGRIRIEANTIDLVGRSNPMYTLLMPLEDSTAVVWPSAFAPVLLADSIAGMPVPSDPRAQFTGFADVGVGTLAPVDLLLTARHVPVDWLVDARVVLRSGRAYIAQAHLISGDSVLSTWKATLDTLPDLDYVAIEARARKP